jgi:hypothetical protein
MTPRRIHPIADQVADEPGDRGPYKRCPRCHERLVQHSDRGGDYLYCEYCDTAEWYACALGDCVLTDRHDLHRYNSGSDEYAYWVWACQPCIDTVTADWFQGQSAEWFRATRDTQPGAAVAAEDTP